MNELIETFTLICIHSLWIGSLVSLLVALLLNVTPESKPQVRSLTAWAGLIGTATLSIVSVRFTSPLPVFEIHIPTVLQNGIVVLWLVGFSVCLLRLAQGCLGIYSLKIHSIPVTDGELVAQFGEAMHRSNSRRKIALRSSHAITGPVLIGWLFPTVIIPASWLAGVPVSHLRAIFAHELAHAYRRDFLFNLILRLIESVFFFNPAIWWLSSVIRREREHACDDFAAGISNGANAYSRALIWFESHRLTSESNGLSLSLGDGPLQSRISRLLRVSNSQPQRKLSSTAAISGASILIMMTLLITMLICGTTIFAKSQQKIHATSTTPVIEVPHPEDSFTPPTSLNPILSLVKSETRWQKPDPLFVSVPLVAKNGTLHDLRQKNPALFTEFPNRYLLENQLDYLNARLPHLDPDGDGFTVMEEYQAGTDPKDPGAHPAFVEKVKFFRRQVQTYKIKFAARPDRERFQLMREPTNKWPRRTTFISKTGEETEDGQLKIGEFVEKEVKKNGISVDASELTVTHLPSGKEFVLVKGESTIIPTYFAELLFKLPVEKKTYVKEGTQFVVPGDDEKWTLDEVKEESCTISRITGDSDKVEKILKKED